MRKVLIAPAAFKGTISAPRAAELMVEVVAGFTRGAGPVDVTVCPIADGGDDTLEVLGRVERGYRPYSAEVTGPLPSFLVRAEYLYDPDRREALVEAARAHGMTRMPGGRLDALGTTSHGVGELLRHVVETHPGLKTVTVTLGGSASTDGGAGALQALGWRFADTEGRVFSWPLTGGDLRRIRAADVSGALGMAASGDFPRVVLATDVLNPLCGPLGAAAVYAPQKGAGPEERAILEEGLENLAGVLGRTLGRDARDTPGSGAAGGLAFGLACLPGAEIRSGSRWIAALLDLEAKIRRADLILTGEGGFDTQSLSGKATGLLVEMADGKRVMFFCGRVDPGLALPPGVSVHVLPGDGDDAGERLFRGVRAAMEGINR